MTAASAGSRYPRTRRISFPFGGDGGTHGKYFVNDDIVFSHFVANLSGAFPSGEELFIRSVRRFSDEPPVSLRVTPRRRENGGRVACRRRR